MLSPATLEKRFVPLERPLEIEFVPRVLALPARAPRMSEFHLVMAIIAAVAALVVVTAAVRMTERSINQAVDAREAPVRFLADELAALRLMALSSKSVVPARLYIGIDECFRQRAPIPFDEAHLALAKQNLAACADMELGRLYAQGGPEMAQQGRDVLRQTALLK
jgi:hypothetical protein